MTFEVALSRLEAIVRELERDDVPLDRALELFEEGVSQLKAAAGELNRADTVLKTLVQRADGTLETLDVDG
ncbi:MAG: exodeoxyribonuclease VII small subunit [Gemmatimonadaceae bacterium]